jgi:hypothetical protein
MAPPEEPARTPADPEQRKDRRPWNWILLTALAAVLVIAGAILGAAELVSSHSSDSSGASQLPNISNNNTNQNSNKNGQSQSQQQGGQGGGGQAQSGGGQAQSQAVIVPYGQPFKQGGNLQQRVRIEINNTVTTGIKVFYLSGWYVLAGPCRYRAAAGGCTGRWFGPQRPPGYSPQLPPMSYRQQPSMPPQTNSPSTPTPSQQPPSTRPSSPPSSPPSATPSPQPSASSFSTSALEQAVAAEQEQALAAAPSSSFDYTGPGNVTVTVSCTGSPTSSTTYDCTARDGEGDSGTDVVTVNADGTQWSDTGMTWTGPYVTSSTFVAPSVSDQAIPASEG